MKKLLSTVIYRREKQNKYYFKTYKNTQGFALCIFFYKPTDVFYLTSSNLKKICYDINMTFKSCKKLNFSDGFTLAEVLITLVIIGVIAAMTIPTLMKNTEKQELVSGLKKANSTLQQAMINISRNNDAAVGDYSFLREVDLIDEMVKVLNVVKLCTDTADCFGSDYNSQYKLLKGSGLSNMGNGKGFISSDGMIYVYVPQTNTTFNANHGQSAEDTPNILGYIMVDVNGPKLPNTWGYDLFLFDLVSNKGMLPGGSDNFSNCVKTSMGVSCAARVLKENAINY